MKTFEKWEVNVQTWCFQVLYRVAIGCSDFSLKIWIPKQFRSAFILFFFRFPSKRPNLGRPCPLKTKTRYFRLTTDKCILFEVRQIFNVCDAIFQLPFGFFIVNVISYIHSKRKRNKCESITSFTRHDKWIKTKWVFLFGFISKLIKTTKSTSKKINNRNVIRKLANIRDFTRCGSGGGGVCVKWAFKLIHSTDNRNIWIL